MPSAPSGTATTATVHPSVAPQRVELPETDAPLWAIIFAGGIGSRFWPLSTPSRPKPLLRLVSEQPLLVDTVHRLAPVVPPDRVIVLTSRDIAPAIQVALATVPEMNILVEPRPLGTAAALAWGAQEVARRVGPHALCCAMHADLAVGFPDEFRRVLRRAGAVAAREKALVAVGIRPTRVEPGFGYIRPGAPVDSQHLLADGGVHEVSAFFEKPSAADAMTFVSAGALWHSGILVGTATEFLTQLAEKTPELRDGLDALRAGNLPAFVGSIRSVGIERGLLERGARLLVIPGDFEWDDVGTWASLRRARALDDDGNGVVGDAHFVEADSNVVHGEHGVVVMYGVSKLLVVSLPGLTFVTTLDRAADLNPLLDSLPGSMRISPSKGST
ncbi:MAG: NTP transferase domain-containing protein [Gemmatimonadaceae bacterium]|nr:NTP transferase domain-containing protein [Gemmatimonadaceae bacterium]